MTESEWKKVRLTDFVWFQRGFDLPKNKFMPGNIPVYGSTSILGYHNQSKVKGPGIITGRSGTIGKFQYSTGEFWPHNTSLWVKDFKGNSPKFAFYLLHCLDFKSMNTGGAVPTLNRNLLSSFIVDVPSIKTQNKIASILSAYDDLIENNLKRIKLLEEKAQLTYEEWFVRMKYPGHENDKVDSETGLPEGWTKYMLSEAADFLNGYAFKPEDLGEKGYPVIKIKEMKNGVVSDTPRNLGDLINEKYLVNKGDILFSWSATLEVIIWKEETGLLNQHLFKVTPKEPFKRSYVYLACKNALKQFELLTTGATMKHIKRKELDFVTANFPGDRLMSSFEKEVEPLLEAMERFKELIGQLNVAKGILLPRLMSGMIDIDEVKYNYPKEISA